jgi:hypothetical protein
MIQIHSSNPTPDPNGGADFDRLTVTMAISPIATPSSIGASVAVRLTPYRENEDGTFEYLPEAVKPVVFGDAMAAAAGDTALAQVMGTMLYALQEFVTAKGL